MMQEPYGLPLLLILLMMPTMGCQNTTFMQVLFSIEVNITTTTNTSNTNNIIFNASSLSQFSLVDPATHATLVQGVSAPTATGAEYSPPPINWAPCTENVTFLNTSLPASSSQCQNCTACDRNTKLVYTVQKCTLGSDTVCDSLCPAGTVGDGSKFCEPCPAGTYAPDRGSSWCYACEEGFYARTGGQKQCTVCPSGSTTSLLSGFTACVQVCENIYMKVGRAPKTNSIHSAFGIYIY